MTPPMARLDPGSSDPEGTIRSYALYYQSGSYDRRYPAPNPRVLAHARRLAGPRTHLIDFGCGSGRYLLALKDGVRLAAGFDPSAAGLDLLRARAAAQGGAPVQVLGPDPGDLARHVARHGPADLMLCLFGVLGHILPRAARLQTLARMRAALAPGGRLLLSVPNRRRRFAREQRHAGAEGAIHYRRQIAGAELCLPYQLFDPESLTAELAAAGFAVARLRAESVLPEAWLLAGRAPRLLDAALTPPCPARWGYGLLAEAVPA